jgi:hypothetical protein
LADDTGKLQARIEALEGAVAGFNVLAAQVKEVLGDLIDDGYGALPADLGEFATAENVEPVEVERMKVRHARLKRLGHNRASFK